MLSKKSPRLQSPKTTIFWKSMGVKGRSEFLGPRDRPVFPQKEYSFIRVTKWPGCTTVGSYFISAVCEVLDEEATSSEDLLSMLTEAVRRVATEKPQVQIIKGIRQNNSYQVPLICSMLTRKVVFSAPQDNSSEWDSDQMRNWKLAKMGLSIVRVILNWKKNIVQIREGIQKKRFF